MYHCPHPPPPIPGIPIKPMLAKICEGLPDAIQQLRGAPFLGADHAVLGRLVPLEHAARRGSICLAHLTLA